MTKRVNFFGLLMRSRMRGGVVMIVLGGLLPLGGGVGTAVAQEEVDGARWYRGRRIYDRRITLDASAPATAPRMPDPDESRRPSMRDPESRLRVEPLTPAAGVVPPPPRPRPRIREDDEEEEGTPWLLDDPVGAANGQADVGDVLTQEWGSWGWLAEEVMARQRTERQEEDAEDADEAERAEEEVMQGLLFGADASREPGQTGDGQSGASGLLVREPMERSDPTAAWSPVLGIGERQAGTEDLFDRLFTRREAGIAPVEDRAWEAAPGNGVVNGERGAGLRPRPEERARPGIVERDEALPGIADRLPGSEDILAEMRRRHAAPIDSGGPSWGLPGLPEASRPSRSVEEAPRTAFRGESDWATASPPAYERPTEPVREPFRTGRDSWSTPHGMPADRPAGFGTFSEDWAPPRIRTREPAAGVIDDPLFRR